MANRLRFLRMAIVAAVAVGFVPNPAHAGSLTASYFSMAENDPDVGNDQGIGTVSTVVGAGLGPDGLPVVSAFGAANLIDVNGSGELTWWSPAFNTDVSVLNNPVYPASITLPFTDNAMYTNSTVLGVDGDDASAFLTAEFTGNFSVPDASTVNFNVCSDDDEFVYLSGGVFGAGTNVVDNGGIHGVSCQSGNENTGLLTNVAAGNYTLTVFYADREASGAAFQISSTLDLTPTGAPEPGTLILLLGAAVAGFPLIRRGRA
jgi:fibro-slime domain-containing protein